MSDTFLAGFFNSLLNNSWEKSTKGSLIQTDKSRAHCSVFPLHWRRSKNPPTANCVVRIGKTWLTTWENHSIVIVWLIDRACACHFIPDRLIFIHILVFYVPVPDTEDHAVSWSIKLNHLYVGGHFQGSSRRFEVKRQMNQVYLRPLVSTSWNNNWKMQNI